MSDLTATIEENSIDVEVVENTITVTTEEGIDVTLSTPNVEATIEENTIEVTTERTVTATTSAQTKQITAGATLGGHRVVTVDDSDQAVYADKDDADQVHAIAGITTGAAESGAAATVQYGGDMTEPTWSWTPRRPVFLGRNGQLTQTVSSGHVVCVAWARTATKITINLTPIVTKLE